MFANTSYDELMNEYLSYAPKDIDTRQGSVYYDAGAGFVFLLSRFYADLENIYNAISLTSAVGEYLDEQGKNFGIERLAAVKARYICDYVGEKPPDGSAFFCEGIFFEFEEGEDGVSFLTAREAGSAANVMAAGMAAVAVDSIAGLEKVVFGNIERYGSDTESDDDYRERIREKLSGPAENGNKQHYKTWCESFEGVGSARIIVPQDESFCVRAVILDSEGSAAAVNLVEQIQDFIDPHENGDGSGAANIGAKFTAISPSEKRIDVTFSGVQWDESKYSRPQAEGIVKTAVEKYFRESNLNFDGDSSYFISAAKIGAAAILSGGIGNYDAVTISTQGESVGNSLEIDVCEFAHLGELSI